MTPPAVVYSVVFLPASWQVRRSSSTRFEKARCEVVLVLSKGMSSWVTSTAWPDHGKEDLAQPLCASSPNEEVRDECVSIFSEVGWAQESRHKSLSVPFASLHLASYLQPPPPSRAQRFLAALRPPVTGPSTAKYKRTFK